MSTMNREEHLAWCKERAMEHWRKGDLVNAVASMESDLGKHPETCTSNPFLAMLGTLYVAQGDAWGVQRWIEGFR